MLEEEDGSVEIGPEEGFGGLQPTLIFTPTTESKTTKLRLQIDVNPVGAELESVLALGVRPAEIGQRGEENWHVVGDPRATSSGLPRRRVS